MYENYERNDKKAWVRSDLKGCSIIKNVLVVATEKNIVLPVWECGEFVKK